MNTDKKNIPDEIFEYIRQHPFAELTGSEKGLVLEHFSAEEYNLLYNTTLDLRKLKDHSASKESLLRQFDQKYGNKRRLNLDLNGAWKAAAAVLLVGVLIMQFMLISRSRETTVAISGIRDTVYVVKNLVADTVRIYDTIFKSTASKSGEYNTLVIDRKDKEENTQIAPVRINELSGLNIVRVNDLESTLNRQRKSSIKDDTLIKQISFVRL